MAGNVGSDIYEGTHGGQVLSISFVAFRVLILVSNFDVEGVAVGVGDGCNCPIQRVFGAHILMLFACL
jgi:hypothetical protein